MTDKINWIALLDKDTPWQECYPVVEQYTMAYLDKLPVDDIIPTTVLTDEIVGRDAPRCTKQRFMKGLKACREHGSLARYCTVKDKVARKMYGGTRMVRPVVWHQSQSRPEVRCKTCNQVIESLS